MDRPPAEPSPSSPSRRPRRRWSWLVPLLAIVLPLCVVAAGLSLLWQHRGAALQLAAPYIANAAGWGPAAVSVQRVDAEGLGLADLVLGADGAVAADRVDLDFTFGDLIARRVDAVTIDGLRLRARLVDGRLVVTPGDGAAAPPEDGSAEPAPVRLPALPFDRATLTNMTVALEMPEGTATLQGDIAVIPDGNGAILTRIDAGLAADSGVAGAGPAEARIVGTADLSNVGDSGVAGTFDLALDGAAFGVVGAVLAGATVALGENGDAEGAFAVKDGALSHGGTDIAVAGLRGDGSFRRRGGTITDAALELGYDRLTAYGQELQPGQATLALANGIVDLRTVATLPDAILDLTASGPIDDAAVPVRFAARGETTLSLLRALTGQPHSGSGRVAFDLAGDVRDPLRLVSAPPILPLTWLDHLDVNGAVEVSAAGLDLPNIASGAAAVGLLTVATDSSAVIIEAPSGLSLRAEELLTPLPPDLPPALATLAGPLTLDLGGEAGTRPSLRIERTEAGHRIDATAGLRIAELFGGTSLEATGSVTLDEQMALAGFELPFLLVTAASASHGDFAGPLELLLSEVSGTATEASGALSLGIQSASGTVGGLALTDVAGEMAGAFRFDGEALSFSPDLATRLSIGGVAGPAGTTSRAPIVLALDEAAPRAVRLPVGGPLELSLAFAPVPLALSFGDSASPTTLELQLDELRLDADADGLRVAFADIGASLPGQPLRLEDISAQVSIDRAGQPTGGLTIGSIVHTGNPRFVVPLRAEATVSPASDGRLALAAQVVDRSGRLSLDLIGRHDPSSGQGTADVALKTITFLPTVLQPAGLFPVLRGRTQEVDADLSANATLRWGDGQIETPGALSFSVRALTTGEFRLEEVNGSVAFESLMPFATLPDQEVQIGLADVGVPLRDGRLVFTLRPGSELVAQLRDMEMLGGLIESTPITYSPGTDPTTVVLQARGVELGELLSLAKLGELSASGTLDGSIPIVISQGEFAVQGGVLNTKPGGGILRYKPEDVGPALRNADASAGLFLDAVENFHYDSIRVTLDETNAEEMAIGLHLEGNNPDLYGGAPLQLNVNLSGPLRQLLDRGIRTYTLPDRIREQVADFDEVEEGTVNPP